MRLLAFRKRLSMIKIARIVKSMIIRTVATAFFFFWLFPIVSIAILSLLLLKCACGYQLDHIDDHNHD